MKLLAVETSTDACSAALYVDGETIENFEIAPRQHTKLILPMIDRLMADAQLKPQQLDGVALSRGPGSFTGVRIATGVVHGIAFGADLPVALVSTLAAIAQDFFNRHKKGAAQGCASAAKSRMLAEAAAQGCASAAKSRMLAEAAAQGCASVAKSRMLAEAAAQGCASAAGGGTPEATVSFTAMDARMDEIFWGVYRRDDAGLAKLIGREAVTPAAEAVFPELEGFGVGSGWAVYGETLSKRLGRRVQGTETRIWPRAACIAQLGVYDFANGIAVPVEQAMPVYLRDKVAKKQSER
ncbi:tRNA (adenosine(37)-N6)-threonylcarbamoyltransferase complex dimerization subunit type 1 TsaB [Methylomonas sp. MgM2]